MAHVEAVCAGTVRPSPFGTLGLAGDAVADHRHHGGPDQAVYAFAREDYAHWEAELGRRFAPGSFR